MPSASKGTYLKIALAVAVLCVAVAARLSYDSVRRMWMGGTYTAEAQSQMAAAQRLYKQRRLVEAREAFEKASQLAPEDARPYNWLTTLALETKRPDLALQSIDESLKRNPDDSQVWRTAGDIFVMQGEKRSALKSYRQATIVNPKDSVAWKCLGFLESGIDPGESIRALRQAAALAPGDFETELALGQTALETGDIATAGQALQKALALQPTEPRALLSYSQLLMMTDISLDTLKRAGEQIDAAMRIDPSAKAYLLRGRLRLLQRRYSDAISDLNEAIRRDPQLPPPHAYLSQAYAAAHQPSLARSEADAFTRTSSRLRARHTPDGSSNP